jgi:hypothetical protein
MKQNIIRYIFNKLRNEILGGPRDVVCSTVYEIHLHIYYTEYMSDVMRDEIKDYFEENAID